MQKFTKQSLVTLFKIPSNTVQAHLRMFPTGRYAHVEVPKVLARK
jgi:hypothetical protein